LLLTAYSIGSEPHRVQTAFGFTASSQSRYPRHKSFASLRQPTRQLQLHGALSNFTEPMANSTAHPPRLQVSEQKDKKNISELEHLYTKGFTLIPNPKLAVAPQMSHHLIKTIRQHHQPILSNSDHVCIHIRWSKSVKSLSPQNNTARTHTPWTLMSSKNCNHSAVGDLTNQLPIFEIADSFFQHIDSLLRPSLTHKSVDIINEIRYIDPVKQLTKEDTSWHQDDIPVLLTATTSLIGPGTVFSDTKDLKSNTNQTHNLQSRPSTQAPRYMTLVFFGKEAHTKPLWHKSPNTALPRLLLIYRIYLSTD